MLRNLLHVRLSTHQWLGLILLGHVLLAFFYSVIIPPWEAHDEWAHYRYAAYIAETRSLPDPGRRLTTEFEFDEASQPPLYYLLASLPMYFVDTQDGYAPAVNPYVSGESAQTGVNMTIHDPMVESFPWKGTILALHLGRLMSIFISLLALIVTYRLIRYIAPNRPEIAIWGVAVQAFAPQFVFLSAVMTNDILVILLSPLLLYLSLRLIEEGPKPRLTLLVSLVAGLALLTKYLALAIIPLALLAFLWGIWRKRHQPQMWRQLTWSFLIFVGMLALTGGSLLWRNYQYTGVWIPRDPVSQQSIITGLEQGELAVDWALLPEALQNGFYTYWVSFGWGNLAPEKWVYGVWLGMILVGMMGALLWLVKEGGARSRRIVAFLALFVFAAVSFPLLRELLHHSPFLRGRYMLSTLPVAAWLMVQGWAYLFGAYWRKIRWSLILWPLGLSLFLPFTLLLPAYAPPKALASPPSDDAYPLDAQFGEYATLLGASVWPADEVQVGQGFAVTLTWRILARSDVPYSLNIQLVGAGNQRYASLVTYPGHGNAATNVWQPGTIFRETYWLVVQPDAPLPTSARVLVTLFNLEAVPSHLPVFDSQGNYAGDSVFFGSIRISSDVPPPNPYEFSEAKAVFGQTLQLMDVTVEEGVHEPGDALPVWIEWRALGPGPQDVLLSLQLLDADGRWVAGDDGPVSNILLPQHWRENDMLQTTRWFSIPEELAPGTYHLMVALYRSSDLVRLPAVGEHNQLLADNLYRASALTIR